MLSWGVFILSTILRHLPYDLDLQQDRCDSLKCRRDKLECLVSIAARFLKWRSRVRILRNRQAP